MSSFSSDPNDAAAGLADIGRAAGGGASNEPPSGENNGGGGGDEDSSAPPSSWRERIGASIARSRKVHGGNYVQIATVDPETGEPRCRTVVFRGFLPLPPTRGDAEQDDDEEDGTAVLGGESTVMKMITDLRSSKVREASSGGRRRSPVAEESSAAGGGRASSSSNGSNAEMVWWFGKSSEQYRIRGRVEFVGGGNFDRDGDEFFARARKEQWGNLSDMAREQFYWKEPGVPYVPQAPVPPGGRGEDGKVLPPPNNFLLMLLFPNRVDYLRLGDNFRQIDQLDGGRWKLERVNP